MKKQKKEIHSWLKVLLNTFLFFIAIAIVGFISILIISKDLPSLEQLQKFDPEMVSKIYSADGVLLKQLYTHKRDIVSREIRFDRVAKCIKKNEETKLR